MLRERIAPRTRRILLVLSHMRAGSSLFHHLLLQHPLVAGAGERNKPYRSPRDLDRLVADASIAQRRLGRRAAVYVDQVNHDFLLADPALLALPGVEVIFLVCRPAAAVASLTLALGRDYGLTEAEAVTYYEQRLATLGRLAVAAPDGRALGIHYEALVNAPEAALARLGRHLALPPPALEPHYPLNRFTGVGDASDPIRAGRVVTPPRRRLALEPNVLERLEAAYAAFNQRVEARFEMVASTPS